MVLRPFGIRLFTQGKEGVQRDMRETGQSGDNAFRKIEAAQRRPTRGLRLFNQASIETQQGLDGIARRAPAISRLTGVLGPLGIAAGITAGAFVAIRSSARSAAEEIASIGDAADRAQFDVEQFERLQAALLLEGQTAQGLEASLAGFNRRIGEAVNGNAEAIRTFEQLGIDIRAVTEAGEGAEEILFRVADGFAAIDDPARNAALSQRLFEEGGRALLTILDDGSEALRRQGDRAEELGLTFGGAVIRNAQQLNVAFEQQARIVDVQLKTAFLEAGPAVTAIGDNIAATLPVILQFVGTVSAGINELLALLALADRPLRAQLQRSVEELREVQDEIARISQGGGRSGRNRTDGRLAALQEREAELIAQNRALAAQLESQAALSRQPAQITLPDVPGVGGVGGRGRNAAEAPDAFARAIEAAERQVRTTDQQARSFGLAADAVARLKLEEDLLRAARDDGEVTEDEAAAIARLTDRIGEATAALESKRLAAQRDAEATRAAEQAFDSLSRSAVQTLQGLVDGTLSWESALIGLLGTILEIDSVQAGLREGFGNIFTGQALSSIVPFARGGIINSPTQFLFGGGQRGIVSEFGQEELIAPVIRDSRGRAGVSMVAGPAPEVNIQILTRDPDTQVRMMPSRGQQAREAGNAVSRGARFQ